MTLRFVEELNLKFLVLALEEYNRWSDKWKPLLYPFKEELVDSGTSED